MNKKSYESITLVCRTCGWTYHPVKGVADHGYCTSDCEIADQQKLDAEPTISLEMQIAELKTELAAIIAERDAAPAPAPLTVTAFQVWPVRAPKGKLRAHARICLADQLQLTGLRIYDGCNGLFVSYPNDPNEKGDDYRQLFYPLTRELRDHIERVLIAEFHVRDAEAQA